MKYLLLLLMAISLQSCYTTRYVSIEPELRRDFVGASVDDIEFEFGNPDEEQDLRNGYAYIYNHQGGAKDYRNRPIGQYTRFSFDNSDYVRSVQSTRTQRRRVFSAGKTVFGCVMWLVVAPTAIIVIATATAE